MIRLFELGNHAPAAKKLPQAAIVIDQAKGGGARERKA